MQDYALSSHLERTDLWYVELILPFCQFFSILAFLHEQNPDPMCFL